VRDVDAQLWRTLSRVWWVLTFGVLGLLLGLGSPPQRSDAVLGLLVVTVVAVLVATTVWRMPRRARAALRVLPRHRPRLALTALLLGGVTVLVLGWTVADLLVPGTLSPLSIALLGLVAAGIVRLLGRLSGRA
jgi:FtsH-binding integral membrane protein